MPFNIFITDRFNAVLLKWFIIDVIVCPLSCLSFTFARFVCDMLGKTCPLGFLFVLFYTCNIVFFSADKCRALSGASSPSVMFVFLSHLVSWAGCEIQLYRFLIFAFSSYLLCLVRNDPAGSTIPLRRYIL